MDIFQITFFLSRSCLGEITPNFKRIYWVVDDRSIIVYFFLEKKDEEEAENIEYEIMPDFQMSVESEPSYDMYEINSKIIYGENDYLNPSNFDILVEFYRKKDIEIEIT